MKKEFECIVLLKATNKVLKLSLDKEASEFFDFLFKGLDSDVLDRLSFLIDTELHERGNVWGNRNENFKD